MASAGRIGSSVVRPEDEWRVARLIPVAGIRGQEEQERRATSALLAVMSAVPAFGHALLRPLGASAGRIRTFAEVRFRDEGEALAIPDGAIVVERGQRRWAALVEVKTGGAELKPDQVSRYIDTTRDRGFDCLITISNQITSRADESPVAIDRRRLRTIGLYHLSWWRILTEAVVQHRFRGISDPDQAWILGELIAYLEHENSGASDVLDMGAQWVHVREGARQGVLRPSDPQVRAVAERWERFLDYLALSLAQELGRDVVPVRRRDSTMATRVDALVRELGERSQLSGALRVPDAAAPLAIVVDLRGRQVTTSVRIKAPPEGRATSRINWMLRQLRAAPPELRIDVAFANVRDTTCARLGEARERPQRLLHPSDPRRSPRSFTLALTRTMGLRRAGLERSFVRETRRQVVDFYGDLVQDLRAWHPRPPQRQPRQNEVVAPDRPSEAEADPAASTTVDEVGESAGEEQFDA